MTGSPSLDLMVQEHYDLKSARLRDAIRLVISTIGDDPTREDLLETPDRVIQSWTEIFSGYTEDDASMLKWFKSDAQEMVIVRDIDFWSTCEHHMLPFWGQADVAYIPNGSVIGVSKIPRLVNHKARRLQIQERLTTEIGRALQDRTLGVAVSIRAHHACMMARGVKQHHSRLVTNFISGKFETDPAARTEFMQGVRQTNGAGS